MCYHVSRPTARALQAGLQSDFRITQADSERHSGFNHPDLPATLSGNSGKIAYLQWGFIPTWVNSAEQAQKLQNISLNARAETMFEKPMFRDAALHHRCVIWLAGFYEWQHAGKEKIPYFIHLPEGELLGVGGLMSTWNSPETGADVQTCSIITTNANELMAEIHNTKKRMPLILPKEARDEWLSADADQVAIEKLLQPFENGRLIAEKVREEPKKESPQASLF